MAANHVLDSAGTNIAGSLQKFFSKAMMGLPYSTFDSPLANAETGIAGDIKIPQHAGNFAEFRYFDHFDPPTDSNDSPKLYDDRSEPSGLTMSATVVRIPLLEMASYISLGPLLNTTDPIDLLKKAQEAMVTQLRRYVHRTVNDSFVNQITDDNSVTGDYTTAKIATPFNSIFAANKSGYDQLEETDYFTLKDVGRMVAIFDRTPKHRFRYPDGSYRCVISHSVKNQFTQEDPRFYDFVKRHQDSAKTVLQANMLPQWNNVRFLVQDDEYRSGLPIASGDPNTRTDSGGVEAIHFLNYGSFGYVDLAGKSRLAPRFKTQDISITGIEVTSAYRIPFRAAPIRPNSGLNMFGTTEFGEQSNDFSIAA